MLDAVEGERRRGGGWPTGCRDGEGNQVPGEVDEPECSGRRARQPLQGLGAGLCLTDRPQRAAGREDRRCQRHALQEEEVACVGRLR